MSSRKLTVALSDRATQDYEDILLYSLPIWGQPQADAYRAKLDRALAEIGNYPEIGQRLDPPRTDIRRLQAGEHVVFDRIDGDTIRVNRILHGRMDAPRYLDP